MGHGRWYINKQSETWVSRGSLGGDDSAQGMTARQNDAAVVDFGRRNAGNLWFGQGGALGQRSAAGRAPVGFLVDGEDSMAMGANPFHEARLPEAHGIRDVRKRRPESSGDQAAGLIWRTIPVAQVSISAQSRMSAAGIFANGFAGRCVARLKGNGRVFGSHRPPKICTSAGQNHL